MRRPEMSADIALALCGERGGGMQGHRDSQRGRAAPERPFRATQWTLKDGARMATSVGSQ